MNSYASEWALGLESMSRGWVCVGGVCVDVFQRLRARLQPGKNEIAELVQTIGGGAGNVAQGLRRLSPEKPITLLAPLGNDGRGAEIARHMAARHIAMPWRPIDGSVTSCSFIATHDGVGTITAHPGVRKSALPVELLNRLLASAAACMLTSPGCNTHVETVTRLAARHRVPVYFGPNGEQLKLGVAGLRAVLAGPVELCICNRGEAQKLTGLDDLDAMLAAMRSLDARRVVITDGVNGLHGLDEDGMVSVAAYCDDRPFLDDIGCGDAAQSAIVHFLLDGASLEEAMRAGARQGFEAGTAVGTSTALASLDALREAAQGMAVCV